MFLSCVISKFVALPKLTKAIVLSTFLCLMFNSAFADQISSPLVVNNSGRQVIAPLQIASAAQRVVFRTRLPNQQFAVFSVDASSCENSPVRLSLPTDPSSTNGVAFPARISPNENFVIYVATAVDPTPTQELFRVPIGGGSSIKMHPDLPANMSVSPQFRLSADNRWVVYLVSDSTNASNSKLMSVPLDLSTAPVLIADLEAGEQFDFGPNNNADPLNQNGFFEISPDSQHVVYRVESSNGTSQINFYSAPIDGGTSPVLLSPESIGANPRFAISADSSRVVYLARHIGDADSGPLGLRSVLIDGASSAVLISNSFDDNGVPRPLGQQLFSSTWRISPDSQRIAYALDLGQGRELYSANITGAETPIILSDLSVGANVGEIVISPDSQFVAYSEIQAPTLDGQTLNDSGIYIAPIETAGSATAVSAELGPGLLANDFSFTVDSTRVIYRSNQSVSNALELFSAQVPNGPATKLHPSFAANRVIIDYQISNDSRWVVFRAGQRAGTSGAPPRLLRAATDASSLDVVSQGLVAGGLLATDNNYISYSATRSQGGAENLYISRHSRSDSSAFTCPGVFFSIKAANGNVFVFVL